jgi:serine/threonine protein kinase
MLSGFEALLSVKDDSAVSSYVSPHMAINNNAVIFEDLEFDHELVTNRSGSATVCNTRYGSRLVVKRGLHCPLPTISNLLSGVFHPSLAHFSVISPSTASDFAIHQGFRSNGSLEPVLFSIFSGTVPSFMTKYTITRSLLSISFGLDYLHSHDLVYGCLHPSNLLFNDNYEISIDLSSCYYMHDIHHSRYSPPESFSSNDPHFSGDIYSFGVFLYELLAGSPLFSPTFSIPELRDDICSGISPSVPSTVNPVIVDLIHRCLSINPSDRPSIETVIDELLKTGPDPFIPENSFPRESLWDFSIELESLNRLTVNWSSSQIVSRLSHSADSGDCYAQDCYGFLLDYGCGCSTDPISAARYYKMSADQGNRTAMFHYGICLLSGRGVEPNFVAAADYYKLSADLGSVDGMLLSASCLENGLGVEQDYVSAAGYSKMCGNLGHVNGLFNYGICLEHGLGVDEDLCLSAHDYKLSAD